MPGSQDWYTRDADPERRKHTPEHGFGIQSGSCGNEYVCLVCKESFQVTPDYIDEFCRIRNKTEEDRKKLLERFGFPYLENTQKTANSA